MLDGRIGNVPGQSIDDLRSIVARLLDVALSSFDGTPRPRDRRHQILVGIIAVEHEHVSVIRRLSGGLEVPSAEVLLRTLLEGWIIALFVASDESGRRAVSYLMKGLNEKKRFYRRLRAVAAQNPQDMELYLRPAGLTSPEDCDERILQIDRDVEEVRANTSFANFPPIAECARSVAPQVEITYATLYGFLLSDEVHVGAKATFRRVWEAPLDSPEHRADTMQKILLTTYSLYLDLLKLGNEHLGRPGRRELQQLAERVPPAIVR